MRAEDPRLDGVSGKVVLYRRWVRGEPGCDLGIRPEDGGSDTASGVLVGMSVDVGLNVG